MVTTEGYESLVRLFFALAMVKTNVDLVVSKHENESEEIVVIVTKHYRVN
jgi:hypothetical protein